MTFLMIVTAASMLLAAAMSVIAWRIAGEERRRSDARVAALAAEIHGFTSDEQGPAPVEVRNAAGARLFTAAPPRGGARPVAIAAAIASVIVAAGAAALAVAPRTPAQPVHDAIVARPPAPRPPLELVALAHERVGDQLTVRGVIRNPPSGPGLDGLTAVVFVFTPDGGFLSSGRAAIGARALEAGGETTFAVTVPRAADVGRYRVSFRVDDRIVPHVDKRHES